MCHRKIVRKASHKKKGKNDRIVITKLSTNTLVVLVICSITTTVHGFQQSITGIIFYEGILSSIYLALNKHSDSM